MRYILNWFIKKMSSAISEGFNNKIKRLKRMAYGYKNPSTLWALKPKIRYYSSNLNTKEPKILWIIALIVYILRAEKGRYTLQPYRMDKFCS
jgi:hypothetical protein